MDTVHVKSATENYFEALSTGIGLCERSAARLGGDEESEKLWFTLLDILVLRQRGIKQLLVLATSSPASISPVSSLALQSSVIDGANAFLSSLGEGIHRLLEALKTSVPLNRVLSKVLNDHSRAEFSEFRETIVSMLGTYSYDNRILHTANSLMAADIFRQVHKLHSGYAQAVSPSRSSHVCAACNTSLVTHLPGNRVAILGGGGGGGKKGGSSSSSGTGQNSSLVLFGCGHTYHDSCLERTGEHDSSSSSSSSSQNLVPICPQCVDRSVSSTSGRLATSSAADGGDDDDVGGGSGGGGGGGGGRNISGRLFNGNSQNASGGGGGDEDEGAAVGNKNAIQHHIDDDGADPHVSRLIRVREKNKSRRSRPLTDIVDDLIAGGDNRQGSSAVGAFKFSAPIKKENEWRISRVRPKDRMTKALNVVVMENSPFGS